MIYRVSTNNGVHCVQLGYATGDVPDIEAYFQDKEIYGLVIAPLEIMVVPKGYAKERARLDREIQVLKDKLAKLEEQ